MNTGATEAPGEGVLRELPVEAPVSPWRRWLAAMSSNAGGCIGLTILAIVVLVTVAAPLLSPYDPIKTSLGARMIPPTLSRMGLGSHPLGTDQLGRDILSRILYGSRVTLLISIGGVIVGGFVGVLMGLVAGFLGSWADRIVMRVVDVQLALPVLLVSLMVIAVIGPNALTLTVVLALTGWTRYARIVRAETLSLKTREFVLASEAAGAKPARIITRHVIPNVATPIVVVATLEMARLILMECSLSFLGLGVQPPAPSWGRMLAEGRQYMESAWWLATLPGGMIVLLILGVSLVGDWLRDFYDPRLQGQR